MYRIISILILLLLSTNGRTQSIINIEKALVASDRKLHISGDVSTALSRGNVNITLLNTEFNLGWQPDSLHIIRVMGGINILNESGNTLNNVGFIHLRHNYVLNNFMKTFAFYQAQYNNIIFLEQRHLAGVGIRLGFHKNHFDFAVLIGAMYEHEDLDEDFLLPNEQSISNLARTATAVSVKYDHKSTHIISTTYFQMDLGNFNDFRILNDTEIRFQITKHFSIFNVFEIRFDSQQPLMLESYDLTNSVGIGINY